MGADAIGAQADQGRSSSTGQQNSADRVGRHGARRRLQGKRGSRAAGVRRRARPECEGEEDVMASGRAADREDPYNSRRNAARILDWDPISELHQGQRSYAPRQWAEHMTAPDHIAKAASKIHLTGGSSVPSYALAGAGAAA